jgi:hypothetical protein
MLRLAVLLLKLESAQIGPMALSVVCKSAQIGPVSQKWLNSSANGSFVTLQIHRGYMMSEYLEMRIPRILFVLSFNKSQCHDIITILIG